MSANPDLPAGRSGILASPLADCEAILDGGGRLRYISPSITKLLGYRPEEVLGSDCLGLVDELDRPGARLVLERCAAERGSVGVFEVRVLTRAEARRRFSVLVRNCRDDVDLAGIVLQCRDITESSLPHEALRTLLDVQRELLGTADPVKVHDRIVAGMLWLFRAKRAILYHVDGDSGGLVCVATAGEADPGKWVGRELPPGAAAAGRAVATGAGQRTPDLTADPSWHLPGWLEERLSQEGCPAAAGAPLVAGGEILGAVVIHDVAGRRFGDDEMALLSAFADQAALACHNARLHRQAGQRADRLARLHALVRSLNATTDAKALLGAVVTAAVEAVGATAAGLLVPDPEVPVLRLRASAGVDPELARETPRPLVIEYGRGITGRVFESRRPEYVEDLRADPRSILRSFAARAGFRACAALPLVVQGETVGVLCVVFGGRRRFDSEERELLELLAGHAAIALRNSETQETLRRMLERSEASEERFRALSEGSDVIVWEADANGRLTFVSRGAEGILGPEVEGVSTLRDLWERLAHPEDRPRLLAFLEIAAAERTSGVTEHRVLGAGGHVFHVLHRVRAARDAAGGLSCLRGVVVDITAEKKGEERQRLQASVTRILAETPAVRGAIQEVLRAICSLLGWDLGEMWLLDREAGLMRWEDMWSAPSVDGDVFGHASAGMAFPLGAGLPGRTWAQARPLWVPDVLIDSDFGRAGEAAAQGFHAAFTFPVRASGEVTGVMLFLSRDIRPADPMLLEVVADLGEHIGQFAERKRMEEALARSQEMLRRAQRLEGLGRLAGGVAHDFNNLLTVIIGRSALLQTALEESSQLRRYADIVHETAERAAAITRQLLAFSRQQMLESRILDLNGIVTGLEEMLRRLIREDIELVVQRAPDLWSAKVDPTQLEQVLMNLVVNARDAMPEGGRLTIRTANVEVSGTGMARAPGARPGPFVVLEVADTGTGMSPEVQARIFEPFFTTKELGRGTGLGLATIYGIVRQHEGWVEVRSQLGRGTTFSVYLPRVQEATAPASKAPTRQATITGSETILLAEDEDEVRRVLVEILETLGYRVIEARGSAEALEQAERLAGPIHLLLTDVVMPGMRGPELARLLTALRPEMRVLYISGHADDAVFREGVVPQDMVLLAKPFTPEALGRKMREVLDRPA